MSKTTRKLKTANIGKNKMKSRERQQKVNPRQNNKIRKTSAKSDALFSKKTNSIKYDTTDRI